MNALTAFVVICGIVVAATGAMIRAKCKRFSGRKEYNPSDLCRIFFSESLLSRSEVLAVLREVSLATDIPLGKLRPSDRFAVELSPVRGWEFDDGLLLLPLRIQRVFGGNATDYATERTITVGGVIEAVAEQKKMRGNGQAVEDSSGR